MITIDERDDVKVPTPDANQVTLFYTDQALRFKDENGDVWTLTKQEDLDEIEEAKPKVYRALLTQSGTNAPVATVLENTLGGEIIWVYDVTGQYVGTLEGAFSSNKVFATINATSDDYIAFRWATLYNYSDDDTFYLRVFDATDNLTNNNTITIEILVYP